MSDMRSVRQAAIEMELAVTKQAFELAAFGARPTLIAELLGKRLAMTEIKRIFRLASLRDTHNGRIPDARKISNLAKSEQATLARLLHNYVAATARKFDPVEALLATWRLHRDAMTENQAMRDNMQLDFELFMVSARHLRGGRIDLRECTNQDCRAPNIFADSQHMLCSSCNRRIDPLQAGTIHGESRSVLVTPAYGPPKPRLAKAA